MNPWEGEFGQSYTDRNPQSADELNVLYMKDYGKTASEMYPSYWDQFPRDLRILEVGCNVGCQLEVLQRMGFTNLYGLDIQWYAVEKARRRLQQVNILQGDALDIPFKDGFFDLVFTAGLLIHIPPVNIQKAAGELRRCSAQYIWGFECFSEDYKEIVYRGKTGMMWTANFPHYLGCPVLKEEKVKVLQHEYSDQMYLLERSHACLS